MADITLHVDEAVERMGDKALYLEVARYFVALLPETIANLKSAMEQENWQEMRRYAHSLKSNCAALGADGVREEAYKLELACNAGEAEEASRLFPVLCLMLEELCQKLQGLS